MTHDPPAAFQASVLLVDDEPKNLVALAAILSPLDVRLVEARSGVEALRRVLDEDFAVILMDVRMPGMDGLEAARLIKQRRRSHNIPIIFVTAGDACGRSAARGYQQGGVDFLLKPYEPEILRAKVSVFVDLEIKRAELAEEESRRRRDEREALTREGEHRFQALIDAMPLAILAARPSGEIYYSNRCWSDYAGLPSPLGTKAWALPSLHPDDRGAARAAWEQALADGRPFDLTCRLRRQGDGTYHWQLARSAPELSSRHEITGWISTATDIDDQRRAAEALGRLLAQTEDARQSAEEASCLKDEFLAIVSHELRTPLTVILGWAKVLHAADTRPDQAPRAVAAIERNAMAQARVVGDLLDVSRILTGKLRLEMQSLDLRAVVQAEIDDLRPTVERKGITLDADVSAVGEIVGDAGRLQQVCWNLLANAMKFTPRGGRVEVRLVERDDAVDLVVSDTGEGVPASFLPHVFERFRQAEATLTRSHGGLGLGLSLVRDLVELHGGTVRVESPGDGQGTTFTVTLPKHAPSPPVRPPPRRRLIDRPRRRARPRGRRRGGRARAHHHRPPELRRRGARGDLGGGRDRYLEADAARRAPQRSRHAARGRLLADPPRTGARRGGGRRDPRRRADGPRRGRDPGARPRGRLPGPRRQTRRPGDAHRSRRGSGGGRAT